MNEEEVRLLSPVKERGGHVTFNSDSVQGEPRRTYRTTESEYVSTGFQSIQFLNSSVDDQTDWVTLDTKAVQEASGEKFLTRFDEKRNTLLLPFQRRPFTVFKIYLTLIDYWLIVLFCLLQILLLFYNTTKYDWVHIFDGMSDEIAKRVGFLLHWDYAILLIPITRKSLLYYITGASYERAIKFHRWIGRWVFVLVVVHFLLVIRGVAQQLLYYDVEFGYYMERTLSKADNVYGEVAGCSTLVIVLTSLEYVRRNWFEVFYNVHIVMFIITMIFGIWHRKWQNFLILLGIPMSLWLIDILYRVWCLSKKRRIISMEVVPGGFAKLEVERRPGETFHASQFMNIYVWEAAWMQWHPISIMSSPMDPNLSFLIKADGGWSSKILKVMQETPHKLTHVRLEGPYGSLTIRPLREYRMLFMIAGGVGATPILSSLKDLMQYDEKFRFVGRHCTFVWSSRNTGLFSHFTEMLGTMHNDFSWDIRLHSSEAGFNETDVDKEWELARMPPIRKGRPSLRQLFVEVRDRAQRSKNVHSIGVFVCGPTPMIHDARNCGELLTTSECRFDVHLETFEM